MEQLDPVRILKVYAKIGKPFEVTISGSSMNPVLSHGNVVTVCKKETYDIGDILIFIYKDQSIISHRLLKIQDGRYFCKGDNSFRLEDITADQIIGAIQLNSDPNKNDAFYAASLQINKIFRACGYQAEKTKQTPAYLQYKKTYLERETEKKIKT